VQAAGQAHRDALRLRAAGLMRVLYSLYLLVIIAGLVLYLVIGLLGL
jgi:hypothetical protein